MRKLALTLTAALALALMVALSTAVALAGWDYEDCPPAAAIAFEKASSVATDTIWPDVNPLVNEHALTAPSKRQATP